jgi:hypothetical protein
MSKKPKGKTLVEVFAAEIPPMRTRQEINELIVHIEQVHRDILTGSLATIQINAPRALMQLSVEARLSVLYWVVGREYKSRLIGAN